MQVYDAPLRDMRFVLNELHADDGFGDIPALSEFTPDLTDAILEEAARFCRDVLLPINRSAPASSSLRYRGRDRRDPLDARRRADHRG